MMDITKIFRSRARKAIFALYFTSPESSYYLRDLERRLDIPVAMLQRELISLEKIGIFASHRKGNLCYYSLNKTYPLFNELKSIVFKTIGVQGTIAEGLRFVKGIDKAFIYGSYAKDSADALSDIDLLVVGKIDDHALIHELRKMEKKLEREINFTCYSPEEFEKEKKIPGGFLNLVLKGKTIILKDRSNDR